MLRFGRGRLAPALAAVCLLATAAFAVDSYTIEEMPTLGGDESDALDVNSVGVVVGFAKLANGDFRAVRWDSKGLKDLGTLGGDFSIAYEINDDGRVVGQAESGDVFGTRYAFYVDKNDAGLTALDNLPDTFNAIARTVDRFGRISGASLEIDEVDAVIWNFAGAVFKLPAFLDEPGAQGDVWDGNDARDLAGWSMHIDSGTGFIGRRAALWPGGDPDGAIVDLGTLGGNGSEARGIDNRGRIVGIAGRPDGASHAFLWEGGAMTDLGDLGDGITPVSSWAQDVNDPGQVVGISQTSPGSEFVAFLWEDGVMYDLNDLILPGSGWVLTRAWAINGVGQIAGQGIAPGGQKRGFLLTPTDVLPCGNGTCDPGEDCFLCPPDCWVGAGAVCGNGTCDTADGEDCLSCPQDCNGKQSGNPSRRFCCGDGAGENPVGCADARCSTGAFSCLDQPNPGTCCGDAVCEGLEDGSTCANDCTSNPTCGDGTCDAGEDPCTCAADCGAPPPSETVCDDGLDDDCDGFIDCDDADCAGDPACTCLPKNAVCSLDEDCCSAVCKANGRCR